MFWPSSKRGIIEETLKGTSPMGRGAHWGNPYLCHRKWTQSNSAGLFLKFRELMMIMDINARFHLVYESSEIKQIMVGPDEREASCYEHYELLLKYLAARLSRVPHLGWMPGKLCTCLRNAARLLPGPSRRLTHTLASRCAPGRWPSQLRELCCWWSCGPWWQLESWRLDGHGWAENKFTKCKASPKAWEINTDYQLNVHL